VLAVAAEWRGGTTGAVTFLLPAARATASALPQHSFDEGTFNPALNNE
jgi:hypothetical protein